MTLIERHLGKEITTRTWDTVVKLARTLSARLLVSAGRRVVLLEIRLVVLRLRVPAADQVEQLHLAELDGWLSAWSEIEPPVRISPSFLTAGS
jgi:hypothetical protein